MLMKYCVRSVVVAAFALAAWTGVSHDANAQVFINTPTIKTKLQPTFWNPNPQGDTGNNVFPQVWVGGGRGYGPGPVGPGPIGPGPVGPGPVGPGPVGPGGYNPGMNGPPGNGFAGNPRPSFTSRGFGRR